MADIVCFFLEPTEFAEESLRRYSQQPCQLKGHHSAIVKIATCTFPKSDYDGEGHDRHPHDDPRWPSSCECGYTFVEEDAWQYNKLRVYGRDEDSSTWTTLDEAPPGAMWFSDFYDWKGPDGHCLSVKTPGGVWTVDAPAWGGGGLPWTRTGEVPQVTATPSINFPGKYHGWLANGILTDC